MLLIQLAIILFFKPLTDFAVVVSGNNRLMFAKERFHQKYTDGKIIQMAFAGYIPASIGVFLS